MEKLLDRMPSLKKTQQPGSCIMPMFGGMQGLDDVREFVKETTVIKVDDNRRRRVAAIHLAAMNGHHGVFEVLRKKFEVDINTPDSDKETALMWAVKKGHLTAMKELIRQGADVNLQNKYDCSALHLAISGNQYDMVKALIISEEIDMNTERIKNPRWPIEMAANHNNLKMVKCLLKKNIKILPANKHEALTIAAKRGYTKVVEAILDKEPDLLNKPDDNGNTALMLAAESGMMETVKFLIQERKAKLTNRNNLRVSIFDIAMQQKSNELLEYLINLNTDGTCLWEINDSFYIHTAVANGDIQKIKFLQDSEGAGVLLQQDENGNSFVHTAAANNCHELLDHLLRDDDDFSELQNKMNETALHVAVKRGHLESVRVLLDKQARLDVADNNGQTPLHAAVASNSASLKIVELLLEKMLGPMQETLLNEQDSNGNTALHLAAMHRRPEVIRLLQKLYPDTENKDGETALHVAAKVGTAEEVRTILQMFYTNTGTNIDHKDEAGYSALYHSACAGDPEKLSLIMSYGADLSQTTDNGGTILHGMIDLNKEYPALSDKYIKVYHEIVDWSTRWYCRKNGFRCPQDHTTKYYLLQMKAVHQLTSGLFYDGWNVLQYACKQGTGELLKKILVTPNVYKFCQNSPLRDKNKMVKQIQGSSEAIGTDDKRGFLALTLAQSPGDVYDVTYLIPGNQPKKEDKMDKEEYRDKDKDKSDGEDVEVRSSQKCCVNISPPIAKSCLGYIVDTDQEEFINAVLDSEPFNFLVRKYWTLCRRVFEALMWIHVIYMILFTYFMIPTSDWLNFRFHILQSTVEEEIVDHFYPISLYGIFLIWPAFILAYELVVAIYFLKHSHRLEMFRKLNIGVITSGLMRIPIGVLVFCFENLSHISSLAFCLSSIAWYVMCVYANNAHSYLESLAFVYIFGWMHTINYVKGFKDWNALASILKQILLKDITRFIYIYIFVFISFGYAVHVLIQADYNMSPDTRSSTNTIYMTFYRMLSPRNILDVSEDQDYKLSGGKVSVLRGICAAYSILSTVVLMNMLIAMMNSTYSEVKSNRSTAWRIESLRMALWFQCHVPLFQVLHLVKVPTMFDHKQNRWYLVHEPEKVELWDEEEDTKDAERVKELDRKRDGDDDDSDDEAAREKMMNCVKELKMEMISSREKDKSQMMNCIAGMMEEMKLLRQSLATKTDDAQKATLEIKNLKAEIKQIHELCLENCQLARLNRSTHS